MIKPNYAFEKRQKQLAKLKKKEEKRLKKLNQAATKNDVEQPGVIEDQEDKKEEEPS